MIKKILLSIGIILLVAVLGFVIWALSPPEPMPEALAAMQSTASVNVTDGEWIVFQPAGSTPAAGFIFYPGGRVDPRSYAPAMQKLADAGYLAVIVPMPLNFAVFGANKAEDVMAAFPEVSKWAVGGHSLGGSMAASFIASGRQPVHGLALWASYPASNTDLSSADLQTSSLYATYDGLVTSEDIEASRALLPSSSEFIAIVGGNHAQFGWYGDQPGDNPASISREDQQAQIVTEMLALLDKLTK